MPDTSRKRTGARAEEIREPGPPSKLRRPMRSVNGCRICVGKVELLVRGQEPELTPARFAPSEHVRGAHGDFYRCLTCGTVQQPSLPPAPQLHELYRRMRDERYLDEEEGRRRTASRLLDRLTPHARAGRLLDVGCGHGLLLDEARRRGYDVLGVELAADAARHARDVLALPVEECALEDAALEPGSFDAVVMTDVLEHLDDPVAAIERCSELLAPGGTLMVTTPDPSSLTARMAGLRWWSYLPAHHCLIPRSTVRELLASLGLVATAEHPYVRVFSLGYWAAGFADRAGSLAEAMQRIIKRLKRQPLLAIALRDEWTYVIRRIEVQRPPRPLADRERPLKVHA